MKTIIVLLIVGIIYFWGFKAVYNLLIGKDTGCDCHSKDNCNSKNCLLNNKTIK